MEYLTAGGRCISHSFDIDLPTECDDEYWTNPDPEQAFKQPPGKPSKVAFFNCFVRLHQILAFAMRTIVRFLSFVFFFSTPSPLFALASLAAVSRAGTLCRRGQG